MGVIVEKRDTAELRRIIKRCCEEADAAGKVALQAMQAIEREAKRRQDQVRELRVRLSEIERLSRQGRAR